MERRRIHRAVFWAKLPASGELVGLDAWASAKVNAVLRRSLLMGAAHLELLARRVGK